MRQRGSRHVRPLEDMGDVVVAHVGLKAQKRKRSGHHKDTCIFPCHCAPPLPDIQSVVVVVVVVCGCLWKEVPVCEICSDRRLVSLLDTPHAGHSGHVAQGATLL